MYSYARAVALLQGNWSQATLRPILRSGELFRARVLDMVVSAWRSTHVSSKVLSAQIGKAFEGFSVPSVRVPKLPLPRILLNRNFALNWDFFGQDMNKACANYALLAAMVLMIPSTVPNRFAGIQVFSEAFGPQMLEDLWQNSADSLQAFSGVFPNVQVAIEKLPSPSDKSLLDEQTWRDLLIASNQSTVSGQHGFFTPLSSGDTELYNQVFQLQAGGQWAEADKMMTGIENKQLMGHVLFQRYMHPTAYTSTYSELLAWLEAYPDHPEAMAVYQLAAKRKPKGVRLPSIEDSTVDVPDTKLEDGFEYMFVRASSRPAGKNMAVRDPRAVKAIQSRVVKMVRGGDGMDALAFITQGEAAAMLQIPEQDALIGYIAADMFYLGEYTKSYKLASSAANRSGKLVPTAQWIAGISAWRLGDASAAGQYFSVLAKNTNIGQASRAAGAFWAARSAKVLGNAEEAKHWLEYSSRYNYTFYGLLAGASLDKPMGKLFGADIKQIQAETAISADATPKKISRDMLERLIATQSGSRALLLLSLGKRDMAEAEFLRIDPRGDSGMTKALTILADEMKMPQLSMQLAAFDRNSQQKSDPKALSSMFPISSWQPVGGFQINPELVYAIIRQESRFMPDVASHKGASGLMQLMPQTGRKMAAKFESSRTISDEVKEALAYGTDGNINLKDPSTNMALGQMYLQHLIGEPDVGTDLVKILAAYNAGPGKVAEWNKTLKIYSDPLLYMESIPYRETRSYVEKVMTNLWMYSIRFGQEPMGLKDLANLRTPRYRTTDSSRRTVTTVQDIEVSSNDVVAVQ